MIHQEIAFFKFDQLIIFLHISFVALFIGIQAGLGLAKSSLSFDWAGVIGARYYLGEKVGVFGEFGTGFSVFKLGATFRL